MEPRQATGGPVPYSATWPRWGTTRSGVAYPLPPSAPPTAGTAGGASPAWRTPRASDGERGGRGDLLAQVRHGRTSRRREWPTPTASDAVGAGGGFGPGRRGGPNLRTAVREATWPTPQARDGDPRRGTPSPDVAARRYHRVGQSHGRCLEDAVAACASATPGPTPNPTRGGTPALNPEWVELLMGFPPGWTALA